MTAATAGFPIALARARGLGQASTWSRVSRRFRLNDRYQVRHGGWSDLHATSVRASLHAGRRPSAAGGARARTSGAAGSSMAPTTVRPRLLALFNAVSEI